MSEQDDSESIDMLDMSNGDHLDSSLGSMSDEESTNNQLFKIERKI